MHPARVLPMALAIGLTLAFAAVPAAARTTGTKSFRVTGTESFQGQIIAPAESGTRHVVSSIIVLKGVFTGVGKIVEVPNRSGDPGNLSRDNLVFPSGTLHIRNTSQPPKVSVDPHTCAVTAAIRQTTRAQGGTGAFRHASGTFASTVRAWGVATRNPDGSCNPQADPLLDADAVSARGTISL
jgi:hypothetical protein